MARSRRESAHCDGITELSSHQQTFATKSAKSRHLRVRAHQKKTSEHCPQRCSGRLFTMSDEDFVDHVEHANSKLLWHWCEPWRGVQSRPGVGEPLLPSLLHVRAA